MDKRDRSECIDHYNTWYSQDIQAYRKFAENRSKATRYNQEYLTELTYNLKDYLMEQKASKQPFTVTGMFMSLNMQKKDYYKARNGEFDWKLYQFADFHGIPLEELDKLDVIEDKLLGSLRIWTDAEGQAYIMETYSTIIDRALLIIQAQLEEALYTSRNPAGQIFILKSRFGWSDKPEQTKHINVTAHVASYEEAKQALQRYGSADEADL